ncbi:MAG: dihydrofolate reductase [Clostridium perfringens]|nr:dihydrofolate reductase [Clostridium perfringens]
MFSIIAAHSQNLVIGNNNSLIWNLPSDLKRFKSLTTGKTIIMGRKTFESLPNLLPNRFHIVLTKNPNNFKNQKDVIFTNNLNEIISKLKNSKEEVFVIGGGDIYKIFLEYTSKIYITEVLKEFKGDTYFPKVNYSLWEKNYESKTFEENNTKFKFKDFSR